MDGTAQPHKPLEPRTDLIRIGTRASPLALAQAYETRDRLMKAHGLAEEQFEIVKIITTGDRVLGQPLAEIGGKGLFTQEIEEALISGAVDLAVHSMKDVPTALPDGLEIAAMLPREDPRDAFISLTAKSLRDLPKGAIIGSSSLRRTAQAHTVRPDLLPVQFRGNVQTRLRKLEEGVAAGTFLAVAGLHRLGLAQHITEVMSLDDMLPAVAQGAIGIEIKSSNTRARQLVDAIQDANTGVAVSCERAFLTELEGSCRTPIAGHAQLINGEVHFRGQVFSADGGKQAQDAGKSSLQNAAALGVEIAKRLKDIQKMWRHAAAE
jgi:hydroxymethylbilane synthase